MSLAGSGEGLGWAMGMGDAATAPGAMWSSVYVKPLAAARGAMWSSGYVNLAAEKMELLSTGR